MQQSEELPIATGLPMWYLIFQRQKEIKIVFRLNTMFLTTSKGVRSCTGNC